MRDGKCKTGKYYKVDVSLSGLTAAEHLVGIGNLVKGFTKTESWADIVDGNGTNALDYMDEMGELDLMGIRGGIG